MRLLVYLCISVQYSGCHFLHIKGLNQKLLTITATEHNGFTVTISAAGETNNIVTIHQTQHGSTSTGEVYLKQTLDYEVNTYMFLILDVLNVLKLIVTTLTVDTVDLIQGDVNGICYRYQINQSINL